MLFCDAGGILTVVGTAAVMEYLCHCLLLDG